MMKKLISFICCLLPMGAGAVVVNPEPGQNSISTEQTAWTDAVSAGSSITINSPTVNGINSANGFSVAGNMYVGAASDQGTVSGDLYVLDTVQNPFTVVSTGDVSIGSILQVLGNTTLGFKTSDTNPNAFNLTVGGGNVNEGIKIGAEGETAKLTLAGIDALKVDGSVIAYGDFSVNAKSVTTGVINANAGNMDIVASDNIAMNGFVVGAGAGATNVSAGGDFVVASTLQNSGGDMTISAEGNIEIAGNMENKSDANLTVSDGSLSVSGAMTNESNAGTLTLNVDRWDVNGGSQQTYSFINNGDLYATVSGRTYMEYGMNLGGMTNDNVFSLDTGTLVFGSNAFESFANSLTNFNLAVRDGDIDVSSIVNGVNSAGGVNQDAQMSILAENVYVTTVRNQGDSLVIKAADLESGYDVVAPAVVDQVGNLYVYGQVAGETGTTTTLIASNMLGVAGAVSNAGVMTLNGNTVALSDVSNSGTGAQMTISSLTETSGTVDIRGNVTNTGGATTIWAKNVNIDGTVTNNSGTTEIRGSDMDGGAVSIGGINAQGGTVDLIALAGSMSIDNDLIVSGGGVSIDGGLRDLTVGGSVQISGDLNAGVDDTPVAGNVNVKVGDATPFVMSSDNAILISGDVNAVNASAVSNLQLDAPVVNITGNATVANKGCLTLGTQATSYVRVAQDLTFNENGTFETYANDLIVGTLSGDAKFIAHGANITANAGDIDVDGNIYFDAANDPAAPTSGMIVRDTTSLTLKTTADDADINVGAVSVGGGNTLTFDAKDAVNIAGVVANNGVLNLDANGAVSVTGVTTNTGTVNMTADNMAMGGVNNSGDITIVSNTGMVDVDYIVTSGDLSITSATNIATDYISQTGGVMDLKAEWLSSQSLTVAGDAGTQANIDVETVLISGNTNVAGDFAQGGSDAMLNLNATDFSANNLTIGGDFIAVSGNTTYDIGSNVAITGNINVADGAVAVIDAGNRISGGDLTNAGSLNLVAARGVVLDEIVNNSGVLNIDSGTGLLEFATLTMNAGNLVLDGAGVSMTGAIATGANLYQNWTGDLADNDVNIVADNYAITTAGLDVVNINQKGKLVVNTSDVDVGGDIIANDLRFVANPRGNWMNVAVNGNVSGDVDFIGLEKMTIGGNYTFNDGSVINAAVLPYAVSGGGINETDVNYWATVSLNDDKTLGQITNAPDAGAMITVGGKFESDLSTLGALTSDGKLGQPQIGINIFDVVDQGTAIWLLHAEEGVEDLAIKIRNLNVSFCNADGSLCYDYLTSLDANNGSDDDLPAYVSVRDVNEDGTADSLYIVFDPRFGGPVEVFKIQPIVGRESDHTDGEYVAAGALDDMIAGQLVNKQFYNRTPIEVIPMIFEGTNLTTMANELYNRMEDYVLNRDGAPLSRFSRLFQVREIEQIAGAIALNEHTSFRSFEDRMFDEFIWNRNRNLNKAWLDVDYGMLYQNIDDGKHTDGHRFSVAGGFDWQESNTLVLGLTGRVSHTTSKATDAMDLSYAGVSQAGEVAVDVKDTDIAVGGYLMKILGEKTRLYGNAFLDLHVFDVDRTQTFVDRIDGDGTAFSLMSEWGLMHDILNQYVVGNAYARVGYNFGFDVKEKAAGDDYMRLESDGYFVLTPGYSLIAQKRIYPSAWFQIRPYASIGVEYDVFGAPDYAKYKFVVADDFTKYDIDIDPLWANIGGGVELLSAHGVQFGIDYRYQYNDAIQLHNIKVSGSYRF